MGAPVALDLPVQMPVGHKLRPLLLGPAKVHAHLRVLHLDLCLRFLLDDVCDASGQVQISILSREACCERLCHGQVTETSKPTLLST